MSFFGRIPNAPFMTGEYFANTLKIGIIKRVDEVTMKADVYLITGGTEQFELDLTQALAGPRTFWGGVPEEGSMIVLGPRQRNKNNSEYMILGYLPKASRSGYRFDPHVAADPSEIAEEDQSGFAETFGSVRRYKKLNLRPGQVGGMSAEGSEISLGEDVRVANRAGDLFELRDAERSLVTQTIHKVHSDGASYQYSGPIRRGDLDVPQYLLGSDGKTLKTEGYFGTDELQQTNPFPGQPNFADSQGTLLDRILSQDIEFPSVMLSTGRRTFYASPSVATNFEDPDTGGVGEAYTEVRTEVRHTSDLVQEVRSEIDGFTISRPNVYIESVLGTYVGNDAFTDINTYGRVLKPKLFESFGDRSAPKPLRLEPAERGPLRDEADTKAAAFVFRIKPPRAVTETTFCASVNKEGKLFLNVPGSKDDDLPDAKNISLEANLEGAMKIRVGKAQPSGLSAHVTLEGGLLLDVGSDATGNAIQVVYHSGVQSAYKGNPNTDDVALTETIQGNREQFVSGNAQDIVAGAATLQVDGGYGVNASRVNVNALNGFTGNYGELNQLVSGKSQFNYAQQVLETIVLGGKIRTILAGAYTGSIVAGAYTETVAAGAMSFNVGTGAYSVAVGAGAVSITTGAGAIAINTGAGPIGITTATGPVAVTSGTAIALTAPVATVVTSPQILLGAAVAPFGVSRGLPMLPPGAPSLCWITGLPVQGSAVLRAL